MAKPGPSNLSFSILSENQYIVPYIVLKILYFYNNLWMCRKVVAVIDPIIGFGLPYPVNYIV